MTTKPKAAKKAAAKKAPAKKVAAKTAKPELTEEARAREQLLRRRNRWLAWCGKPEAMEELAEFIGSGGVTAHLKAWCRQQDFPYMTVLGWINADAGRSHLYELARQARADNIADEVVDVSRLPPERTLQGSVDSGSVQDKRVQIDTLKWAAAKLHPKRYSEKLAVGGADDLAPVQHQVKGELTISPSEAYRKLIGA